MGYELFVDPDPHGLEVSVSFHRFPKLLRLPTEVGFQKTGHNFRVIRVSEFQLVFGALPEISNLRELNAYCNYWCVDTRYPS